MRSETDLQMVLELYREEFEPRYLLIDTSGAVLLEETNLCVRQAGVARGHHGPEPSEQDCLERERLRTAFSSCRGSFS
jgi:hypothetical protein